MFIIGLVLKNDTFLTRKVPINLKLVIKFKNKLKNPVVE